VALLVRQKFVHVDHKLTNTLFKWHSQKQTNNHINTVTNACDSMHVNFDDKIFAIDVEMSAVTLCECGFEGRRW
jgi:hypothetical protein